MFGSPPYLLKGDETLLKQRNSPLTVTRSSWDSFIADKDFGATGDTRFHLGLIPVPFAGNLRNAKIFVLLLNPGLEPNDYFGELRVPGCRERLIRNLRQEFIGVEYPFLYLDPSFSWHSGYRWWHGKFQKIIQELSEQRQTSYAQARRYLSKLLASVELVPYHSFSYKLSPAVQRQLHSQELACSFVKNVLQPRARAGEILMVITRKATVWDLASSKYIVVYKGSQTRAAHLTPQSKGGKRILEFLTQISSPQPS